MKFLGACKIAFKTQPLCLTSTCDVRMLATVIYTMNSEECCYVIEQQSTCVLVVIVFHALGRYLYAVA